MKPFKIILGIAVIALFVAAGMAVKKGYDTKREVREAADLLADIRAMGYATNGYEYLRKIPDSDNAWIEIGPLLLRHDGEQIVRPFNSSLANRLLRAASRERLPLIQEYLGVNAEFRKTMAETLDRKPKYQISADYDYGFALMLTDEYVGLLMASNEFCLAAYAAGLNKDRNLCISNLKIAIRLSNELIGFNQRQSAYTGTQAQRNIYSTSLKIAEEESSLIPDIKQLMLDPSTFAHTDLNRIIGYDFLTQVSSLRHYDDPSLDEHRVPYPLNIVFPQRSASHALADCPVRHGNYIPESQSGRAYFLERLRAWKPLLASLKGLNALEMIPIIQREKLPDSIWRGLPRPLSALAMSTQTYDPESSVYDDNMWYEANLSLWKSIEFRQKHQTFPTGSVVPLRWQTALHKLHPTFGDRYVSFTQDPTSVGQAKALGFPPSKLPVNPQDKFYEPEFREFIERHRRVQ